MDSNANRQQPACSTPRRVMRLVRLGIAETQAISRLVGATNDRRLFGKPAGHWLFLGALGQPSGKPGKMKVVLTFIQREASQIEVSAVPNFYVRVHQRKNLKQLAYIGQSA